MRQRSTSATATRSKAGCLANAFRSESAWPDAPMLAWRSVAPDARDGIEKNGPTAAAAATDWRKRLRDREVLAMGGSLPHSARRDEYRDVTTIMTRFDGRRST